MRLLSSFLFCFFGFYAFWIILSFDIFFFRSQNWFRLRYLTCICCFLIVVWIVGFYVIWILLEVSHVRVWSARVLLQHKYQFSSLDFWHSKWTSHTNRVLVRRVRWRWNFDCSQSMQKFERFSFGWRFQVTRRVLLLHCEQVVKLLLVPRLIWDSICTQERCGCCDMAKKLLKMNSHPIWDNTS